MEWIKSNYDRVALAVVALICLLLCALSVSWAFAFSDFFAERNSKKPKDGKVGAAELASLSEGGKALANPGKWNPYDGAMLASRVYIFKGGELIDPFEGDKPLHPPVPNDWLIKYDLDYSQNNILNSDPDGDGFTVLEEWKTGADPTDSKSMPPYWSKLRLSNSERIPFKVKFSGTPDGGQTFTINFIDDRSKPTGFLEMNETVKIAGVPYTLVKYEAKTVTTNDFEKDVSELTLEDKTTGEKIVLVCNQIIDSPTIYAVFLNLLDGQPLPKVKKGDSFTMPQAPDQSFLLEDISDEKAVIVNQATGEKLEILR